MLIYDIWGRQQEEMQIPKGQEQVKIDVSTYPAGIYFAVLRNEKEILGRRKFVVE
ncbi:MAG: T9SS type A sorting domain-containing protein [Bacteroidales bacterium]|nr:T9SS type A sorting domain-containing protein [Bacteroidales bacterium]